MTSRAQRRSHAARCDSSWRHSIDQKATGARQSETGRSNRKVLQTQGSTFEGRRHWPQGRGTQQVCPAVAAICGQACAWATSCPLRCVAPNWGAGARRCPRTPARLGRLAPINAHQLPRGRLAPTSSRQVGDLALTKAHTSPRMGRLDASECQPVRWLAATWARAQGSVGRGAFVSCRAGPCRAGYGPPRFTGLGAALPSTAAAR